jgi:fatty-acyl-CoA synthase
MEGSPSAKVNLSYGQGTGGPALLGYKIGEVLDRAALLHPDRPALISRHQQLNYSYREFLTEVELAARGFLRLGVQKGDRVGVWATNYAEWVITQFATAKVGALLVTINPAYRAAELEYALAQSECSTLVLIQGFRDCDYLETLASICPEVAAGRPGDLHSRKLPELRNVILIGGPVPRSPFSSAVLEWSELLGMARSIPPEALREREATLDFDDPINIQYTSGTTGFPKGAMLSHHNLVNNGLLVGAAMKFAERDRLCIPVPFYHCFGMVLGNMVCVVAGAAMVLPAPYFNALATLEAVAAEHCTALHGVPTMFIAELEHPEFKRFDLSTLRTGIMAGSPCPIEIMKRVVSEMHCPELTIAYGLTETSPVVTQTSSEDRIELRVATVGKPLPHTEIKIIDAAGRMVPRGQPGELCARGYMVMKGYYKHPEATKRALDRSGWLHSGDIATMGENGYCRITGRVKDMVCRGGENIYPREIEEFLYTHPAVADVQVIGVPDPKYVEQVAAWIKLKEGIVCREDDIRNFCKGRIADFKIPRYIKFVDSFPMTVTGKVQKFKMREASIREWGLEAAAKIQTA